MGSDSLVPGPILSSEAKLAVAFLSVYGIYTSYNEPLTPW